MLWSAKIRSEQQKGMQALVEYGVADVHSVVPYLSCRPDRRESVPPKTACLVPRAEGKAAPDNGVSSSRDGRAREVLRLARRIGNREASDVRQMASDCIQDVLAMEVAKARPSGAPEKYLRAGPPNGRRK